MSECTSTPIDCEFVLRFAKFSKMAEFVADFEVWQAHKAKRAERSVNDQRGKHTKEYHARARIFKHEHPELTYRECMQRIKVAGAAAPPL